MQAGGFPALESPQPGQAVGRGPMASHAPLLCLAGGLLWQEPETGPPRTCDQQGEADIVSSPVQSERLVKAHAHISGDILGSVPDLGPSYVCRLHPHAAHRREVHHLQSILLLGQHLPVVLSGKGLQKDSSASTGSRFILGTLLL